MNKTIRIVIFTFLTLACSGLLHAEIYQIIRLNILHEDIVSVEGEVVTTDALTAAVLKNVRGNDRIRIEIVVPIGMRRVVLKKIMDSCRKAGATSFELVSKT